MDAQREKPTDISPASLQLDTNSGFFSVQIPISWQPNFVT
jgi:hypothetical protein